MQYVCFDYITLVECTLSFGLFLDDRLIFVLILITFGFLLSISLTVVGGATISLDIRVFFCNSLCYFLRDSYNRSASLLLLEIGRVNLAVKVEFGVEFLSLGHLVD